MIHGDEFWRRFDGWPPVMQYSEVVGSAAVAVGEQTELGVAGGLIGQALPVVRAENSDIIVPANAEMVIEGEIPLHDMLPEGPFAEFYGVMGGAKDANFFMEVQTITHRESPWFLNSYSGIIRNAIGVTREATSEDCPTRCWLCRIEERTTRPKRTTRLPPR